MWIVWDILSSHIEVLDLDVIQQRPQSAKTAFLPRVVRVFIPPCASAEFEVKWRNVLISNSSFLQDGQLRTKSKTSQDDKIKSKTSLKALEGNPRLQHVRV
jgi:hypothetical protein